MCLKGKGAPGRGMLGNSNPHLHWHIVLQYKNDPRWGQPIWEGWQRNEFTLNRLALSEKENARIVADIRLQLDFVEM